MSTTKRLDQSDPNYTPGHVCELIYSGTLGQHCNTMTFYSCSCGYWESTTGGCCNLQVVSYSTRTTIYRCSECGKGNVDVS